MFNNPGTKGRLSGQSQEVIMSGEVIDVCIGSEHEFFQKLDVNGNRTGYVKVKMLGADGGMSSTDEEAFWLPPLNRTILSYPLIGELVLCIKSATIESSINPKRQGMYWIHPICLYGDVNANLLPNSSFMSAIGMNDEPGDTFEEKEIQPLNHIEGDTIIQSRWNSALRFSSTAMMSKPKNTWSIGSSDGDPITILTNGYDSSDGTHIEDINKEASTIMMTSTQKIDLAPANPVSPQVVPVPTGPAIPQLPINMYMGNSQVIINSDRLIFNAKKDNVIISAKKDVSISTSKWKLNMTALADILYATLEQLTMEIHPTPCGPTGPPLNAAIYSMLKAQMDQMKN